MTAKKYLLTLLVLAGFILTILSCKQEVTNKNVKTVADTIPKEIEKEIVSDIPEIKKDTIPTDLIYVFNDDENTVRINSLIPTPTDFDRVKVAKNSFAEWLRFLPAKPKASPVRLFNGELKSNQNVHAAVIAIDVGKRDLQQCADAVMRLKSEYHYGRKEFQKIHFNYTSGHKVAFDDWAKGRKPRISGNNVTFSNASGTSDYSYSNFKKYMIQIFNYAGTASLSKELKKVDLEDMQIGDVFIQGGFPGHAVLVMDMAENEDGEKLFLLSQSYMPAQDIHILKNYDSPELSPWYRLDFTERLDTPEWTFKKSDLKRF